MTWRTKLADWISGGELTRARKDADHEYQRANNWRNAACVYRSRIRKIIACETPKANATVRRMAAIAREAVK